MKGALYRDCNRLRMSDSCYIRPINLWLDINLCLGPTCHCLLSTRLVMGSSSVVRGGRIRACCAGHNCNGCADCDQGANAQASNGSASSCASGGSCWCSGCRCWSRLSHRLCGSEAEDCRSDQNFLHGISFWS